MNLFDIANLEKELKENEEKTFESNFWEDSKKSSVVLQKINSIKNKIEQYNKTKKELENVIDIFNLLKEENDDELENELNKSISSLEGSIEKLEISTLLSGPYDSNNAIITLHPGAGGTEAQDWVEMLFRMYSRWANANGYDVKILDYLDGEEAGIKSVTALISGEYAYGR